MENTIAPGTVIDRPLLFEPLCGLELEGVNVIAGGFSGKVIGHSFDCSGGRPSIRISTPEDRIATHFGFAVAPVTLLTEQHAYTVPAGSWFVVPGMLTINGGRGLVVTLHGGAFGLNCLGGPVEKQGRRRSADGCSFTRLYAPPYPGDPVLDLLCVPAALQQDFRKYSSARVGIVASGEGKLLIGGTGEHAGDAIEILAGQCYVVPPGVEYCLHSETELLQVVEWAPDSEAGILELAPSLQAHPEEAAGS